MNEQEQKVLEFTKDTWNAFIELPVQHEDDRDEFRFHIHALQNMILAREGLRKLREEEK